VIQRAGYDLLRVGLRVAVQLWPLWLFWWAWDAADDQWLAYLRSFPGSQPGQVQTLGYQWAYWAWPTAALLGPLVVMVAGVGLYRMTLASRTMALAGVFGMVVTAILTGWPEYQRLWPYVGAPDVSYLAILFAFDLPHLLAVLLGIAASVTGLRVTIRARPIGRRASPSLLRGNSDNFGHAAWLTMRAARKLFPGPDPAYGGIVVGEAYRVDEDPLARRMRFEPRDRRTWGRGGSEPLLIDPCRTGSTHALVLAGSGGFKTTSIGIPTLLTWTGSAVVLDPAREIGPMVTAFRRQRLGHSVVTLEPATATTSGINVLDWIDIASPLADSHVDSVVNWITTENRESSSDSSAFFKGSGRDLITCLLADLLWDPTLSPQQKTLRALQRRLVTPEKKMRSLLATIHAQSASTKARDLAGTLMEQHEETFSGVYGNANRDARWLSTSAYADLVSGGGEGATPALRTADLVRGGTTVFLQIPLPVLLTTPAVGRVLVGALLNAAYQADGAVTGRILFLLDEVARLGYMQLIEQARDAGRKYGITLLLLYQSLGQLVAQWGREGKQTWYDSTAWQLFAAVQDWDTARELSAMCGEYGVVSTSTGDTEGNQSRGAVSASSSSGRSENRSEVKRALIKPDELRSDTRSDEAFVLVRGAKPLRCGRALWFRRPEWAGLVQANRFHRDDHADRDAAE
jgi:type IV secretion system protein VirD4